MECGVLHINENGVPYDKKGCKKPIGHDGPHEFVCSKGKTVCWETDWDCECPNDYCRGDFCTVFWEKH